MNIPAISAYSAIAKTKTNMKPVSFGKVDNIDYRESIIKKEGPTHLSEGDLTIDNKNYHFRYLVIHTERSGVLKGLVNVQNSEGQNTSLSILRYKNGELSKPKISSTKCFNLPKFPVTDPIPKYELLQDIKEITISTAKHIAESSDD